jgi:predicted PurR-regulated permease PerM
MYTLPRYRRVVFGIICILLAIAVTYIMLPFWQALAWGAVLAMLVYPLFSRIKPRFGATWATIITTTATLFFIITPLFLVGLLFAGEVNQIVSELQTERPEGGKALDFSQLIKEANDWLKPTAEGLGMQEFDLQQTLNKAMENSQFNALDIGKKIITGILFT